MAYDAAGNRTWVTHNLGGVATNTCDTANRLTSRQFNDGAGAVLRFDPAYTVRNQLATLTRYSNLAGSTQVGLTSFAYDAVGRETVLQHFNGSASVFQNTTYSYDAAGRMTAEKLNGSTTSYSYDLANQLTADGATTYGYDAAGNRNSHGFTPSSGNQISQDANWTYTYDADGNRTGKTNRSDGSYWLYSYDAADHLTTAKNYDSGGADLMSAVTYQYDAWGNLVERDEYQGLVVIGGGGDGPSMGGADLGVVEAGVTITRYGQDGWKVNQDFWGQRPQFVGNENFDVWAELDNSSGSNTLTVRRFYGDGIDTPTARINYTSGTGAVAWYFQDVRGSVTAVANASGTVKATVHYDGYGNATIDTGSADPTYVDAYRYTGRPLDPITGLQNSRGRWYDPATGTFTVQDPMGFAAGDYNLSRYVGNGPTNATDPSGDQILTKPPSPIIPAPGSGLPQSPPSGPDSTPIRPPLTDEQRQAYVRAILAYVRALEMQNSADAWIWRLVADRLGNGGTLSRDLSDDQIARVRDQIARIQFYQQELSRVERFGFKQACEAEQSLRQAKIDAADKIRQEYIRAQRDYATNVAIFNSNGARRKAEEQASALRALHNALDALGIADPTGIVDFLHSIGYFIGGDWASGGVALAGTIPILGKAGKVAKWARKGFVRDFPTKATRFWSAWFKSEGEARALARAKLGKNPILVEPGKWRSADGKWQYRAKPGDVSDCHIHLEELDPLTGEILQNLHLRWPDGAGQ